LAKSSADIFGSMAILLFLYAMLSLLKAASSSSSPSVLAEISGSLYNTFNALFKVLKTSYKAFLLSVILAGSPNADERL